MDQFKKIKTKLLAEQIEEQILNYIMTVPVAVGEKLPNEFHLGERFGVGRSTIREAVKALISKGVLEIRHGAGTFVVGTAPAAMDPLGLSKVTDKLALALDLVEVRLMLEPAIAEAAAVKATTSDIEALDYLCDKIEQKIAARDSYIKEDIAFHSMIARASKNMVVEQLIPIIDTAVLMFVNVTNQTLTEETVETHRQVVTAIKRRDRLGARTAMTMHLTYNRNLLIEIKEKNKS